MDTTTLFQLLGAGGFAAVLTAVVQGLFSRKRLGADATQIIQKAASGVVVDLERQVAAKAHMITELETQVAGLESREDALEQRVRELERSLEESRTVNQMHVAWDFLAFQELEKKGTHLPPPPPLSPPPKTHFHPEGVRV